MSKQVDFYLISNQVVDAKYKLASRICNKISRLRQSLLAVSQDQAAQADFDRVLWSFSDTSFVAHALLDTPDSDDLSRIHLAIVDKVHSTQLAKGYDVLLNLCSEVPAFSHHFVRVVEIVAPDDSDKTAARERFKAYKSEGFELKTHNIEL